MCHSIPLSHAFVLVVTLGLSTTVADEKNDERVGGAASLRIGFETNDSSHLVRFLEGWHKRLRPVTGPMLAKKPEFERDAYAVFRAFYVPAKTNLEKKYIVVQRELALILVDDDLSGIFAVMGEFLEDGSTPDYRLRELPVISRIKLQDFRPSVSVVGPKVLYLTRDHLRELLRFLVVEPAEEIHRLPLVDRYWELAHGADLAYPEAVAELMARKRRLGYLNSQLNIIPGHWGVGWHFETHPFAYNLYLNRDRTRAVIEFRVGYGGGEVYLKKKKIGDWEVILRQENWDE